MPDSVVAMWSLAQEAAGALINSKNRQDTQDSARFSGVALSQAVSSRKSSLPAALNISTKRPWLP